VDAQDDRRVLLAPVKPGDGWNALVSVLFGKPSQKRNMCYEVWVCRTDLCIHQRAMLPSCAAAGCTGTRLPSAPPRRMAWTFRASRGTAPRRVIAGLLITPSRHFRVKSLMMGLIRDSWRVRRSWRLGMGRPAGRSAMMDPPPLS
jgi:hypothetical protein